MVVVNRAVEAGTRLKAREGTRCPRPQLQPIQTTNSKFRFDEISFKCSQSRICHSEKEWPPNQPLARNPEFMTRFSNTKRSCCAGR